MIALLTLLLFASAAWGQAPAFVTSITYTSPSDLTSHTTGAIAPSGENRGLVICIGAEQSSTDKTITDVTFNSSESFTLVSSSRSAAPTANNHVSVWYLPNPTATSATVTYTIANAVESTATVLAFSGVQQTAPTLEGEYYCDTPAGPPNCATPALGSIELTTVVANTMLLTCANGNQPGGVHTQGDGQTERSEVIGNSHVTSVSTELKVSPGAETLTTEDDSAARFYYSAIGITSGTSRRRVAPWSFR